MKRTPPAEKILAVAIPAFAKNGYDGVSMRDIARDVGVALPSIYFQFKDKRELYLQSIIRVMATANKGPDAALAEPGDAKHRLRGYVVALSKAVLDYPDMLKLISREMIDEDRGGLEHILPSVISDQYVRLLATIEEATGRPASLLSVVSIYALSMGLVQYSIFGGRIEKDLQKTLSSPEALGDHLLQMVFPEVAAELGIEALNTQV